MKRKIIVYYGSENQLWLQEIFESYPLAWTFLINDLPISSTQSVFLICVEFDFDGSPVNITGIDHLVLFDGCKYIYKEVDLYLVGVFKTMLLQVDWRKVGKNG